MLTISSALSAACRKLILKSPVLTEQVLGHMSRDVIISALFVTAFTNQRSSYEFLLQTVTVRVPNNKCASLVYITVDYYLDSQASRYAIQHIWCLSQARINWEGCGRKGIRRKIGGMMEVGASMVPMGWHPAGLLAHLPLLSSHCCLIKSRMMTDSHNTSQV